MRWSNDGVMGNDFLGSRFAEKGHSVGEVLLGWSIGVGDDVSRKCSE